MSLRHTESPGTRPRSLFCQGEATLSDQHAKDGFHENFPSNCFLISRFRALSMHRSSISKNIQSIPAYQILLYCIRKCFTFSQQKKYDIHLLHITSLAPSSFLKSFYHPLFLYTALIPTILNQENLLALIRSEDTSHYYIGT